MVPSQPEDRDVLAGEYVLGLLDPAAMAEVEQALGSDSDLTRRIGFWEERLLPATAALGKVEVDPAQWARIEQTLAMRRRALGPTTPPSLTRPRARILRARGGACAVAGHHGARHGRCDPSSDPAEPRRGAGESPTRYYAILQSRDAAGQESGPGWAHPGRPERHRPVSAAG